jgi:Zn-dependent protease
MIVLEYNPLTFVFFAISIIPAIVVHELAHGWMAIRLGDYTPKLMGRMTSNPRRHIDPFGSLVVPGLLLLPVLFGSPGVPFGYAKSMPIDRSNLRDPDRHGIWIALTGIVANLLLAVPAAIAFRFTGAPVGPFLSEQGGPVSEFLYIWVFTNVLIGVFHIMPIPPLDGARIVAVFLPPRARSLFESWEPYGGIFVLVIFFIIPAPVFFIVSAIVNGVLRLLVG